MPARSSAIRQSTQTLQNGRVPTDVLHADVPKRKGMALSLFWRTFFLLALLLGGGIFAWVQTLRALAFTRPLRLLHQAVTPPNACQPCHWR